MLCNLGNVEKIKSIEVFYLKRKRQRRGNCKYVSAAAVAARCWGGFSIFKNEL